MGRRRWDTLFGGCKHCKTVSPWKPAHHSEASHPPSLSKAKYPDHGAPRRPLASPRLPAWLSSTADVHGGVALDDWIPWLYRKRGRRTDKKSVLQREARGSGSCVCAGIIFTLGVCYTHALSCFSLFVIKERVVNSKVLIMLCCGAQCSISSQKLIYNLLHAADIGKYLHLAISLKIVSDTN